MPEEMETPAGPRRGPRRPARTRVEPSSQMGVVLPLEAGTAGGRKGYPLTVLTASPIASSSFRSSPEMARLKSRFRARSVLTSRGLSEALGLRSIITSRWTAMVTASMQWTVQY